MPSKKSVNYDYESCHPCKFFAHMLFKSGRDPIYESFCEHPSNLKPSFYGREKGRLIDHHGSDRRPDWCPIRGDAQAEKEATDNE